MVTTDLAALGDEELDSYLKSNSGLPGPRANLTLVDLAAASLPRRTLARLAAAPEEFLAMCGGAGLARAALSRRSPIDSELDQVRALVQDSRWRLREGVVRGLQSAAVRYPDAVADTVHRWVRSPDLQVVRAGVEVICEPRLLHSPTMRSAALDACKTATNRLCRTQGQSRADCWRGLEQTLSYAWSVAVAADPVHGLPMFTALDTDPSPLARTIAARNRTKKRLSRLL